jgi:hypothetical protein
METTGSSETSVTIYHTNGITSHKTVFFANAVMRTHSTKYRVISEVSVRSAPNPTTGKIGIEVSTDVKMEVRWGSATTPITQKNLESFSTS